MTRFIPKDHYFDKAKKEGFLARSVFKLEEIDQSLKLIKPEYVILDLGCAPGSWLQYVAKRLGNKGAALGIDLTPIKDSFHPRIKTITADCFTISEEEIRHHISELVLDFNGFDVVLSDMAPKTSGIKHVDQIRSFMLAERALLLTDKFLKKGGHVVIKVFGSKEVDDLILRMKKSFSKVKSMRPKSIRAPSKELYVVGMGKN